MIACLPSRQPAGPVDEAVTGPGPGGVEGTTVGGRRDLHRGLRYDSKSAIQVTFFQSLGNLSSGCFEFTTPRHTPCPDRFLAKEPRVSSPPANAEMSGMEQLTFLEIPVEDSF